MDSREIAEVIIGGHSVTAFKQADLAVAHIEALDKLEAAEKGEKHSLWMLMELQSKLEAAEKELKVMTKKAKDNWEFAHHTFECVMQNMDGKGACICGFKEYLDSIDE